MTQELPEIEKEASYEEDFMDKYSQKAIKKLKDKERQLVNKDAVTVRTNKLN